LEPKAIEDRDSSLLRELTLILTLPLTLASLGGAEEHSGRRIEAKRCLSESVFFSPRDCHDKQRAPQGIQRFALDTDTGGSVFAYFFGSDCHHKR